LIGISSRRFIQLFSNEVGLTPKLFCRVRRFQQVFHVAEDRPAVLDRLLALLGAHFGAGRQVHDTNIVATMLEHGIHRLLTFNVADFGRFAGLIELEPPQ